MGDTLLEAHGIKTDESTAFPGLTTKAQIAELWVSLFSVLDCATDVLVFDPSERPIADDLQRQFEAISKLPEAERAIARVLLEGLVLKHEARRWEQQPESSRSDNSNR